MKVVKLLGICVGVSAILFSVGATNITVSDGATTKKAGWYWDPAWMGTANEDNEVEAACETGQNWDLEAFLLNGSTLTVAAGYDLKNGFDGTIAGDIFVDVGGNPGYDYVYDIDWKAGTYNLYQIDITGAINKITMSPENTVNASSNPVSYTPGSSQSALITNGSLNYKSGIKSGVAMVAATGDAAAGALKGANNWGGSTLNDNHNVASVDVSTFNGMDATFHLTLSCGNDNMMGHATVPEPGSLSLLLMGLVSLAGFAFSRKRK